MTARPRSAILALACLALAGLAPALAGESLSPGPAKVKDVTFDHIKFEHKKGSPFKRSMLTAGIKDLEGKSLRIRGFILPSFQQSGITQFVLVRDNMECCFGPGAAIYDCIVVDMVDGATAEFTTRAVSVEGLFSIQEVLGPDGAPLAIYHLSGKEVK